MAEEKNNPETEDEELTGAAEAEQAESDPEPEELTIEQQLEAVIAEREDLRNQFLRAHAEMENFRKRTNRERTEERRYAALDVIRDILPALDNLERAVKAAQEKEAEPSPLTQGVSMVLKQLEEILGSHGAQPIASHGEAFDPNIHQAVQQVPTNEHPPMTVLQELQRGYKMHERVVRPSQVIVSTQAKESAEETTN